MVFPYKIETLLKFWPIANWVIMAATVAMYVASGFMSDATLDDLVLGGTSPFGLLGHLWLHGGLLHLAGNLLFLWVFGNAVCGMTGNSVYSVLYVGFGVLAGAAHVAFSDVPAIGASGAINGVVGMAFAMYPVNRVSVLWFVFVRGGLVELPLWVLAVVWCAFDAYGALSGAGGVAYWAHLGGFAAGTAAGIVALRRGWLTLTDYDNRTLADLWPKPVAKPKLPTKWSWDEPIKLSDPVEGDDDARR